ncbi:MULTISPECIES: ABC transporter permease [Aerococcus]|uniref:ABC transporter permease subunit n=1 Tax=Aerococcus sanguinicola TaxID=119206 RepID=A0A5N1GPJ3_9LACT|nr:MULTISPECIES: ABC transporter permease subunit [Aerococcus]KAA9301961.1 ABC transporter permease subunit [Aerococcus sanguinicola]MDK6368614.1 ABC transporter permease subunit [Aerococcus sp. UMB9870]MDK6679697.1 ABC transporter permease subunit [Aerococcus sp. UMB8608]MDK6686031.1 ABC transporter permease subunit [Aerococcus sp. UMB8623]MDK6940837.1 ABC transporter permease subunit [Aerococcus sp. UMB8487]
MAEEINEEWLSQLSEADLKDLEAKPKSQAEKAWNRLVCFFPVLASLLHLLEYLYVPNHPGNANTYLYAGFIGIFLAYFLVRGIWAQVSDDQFRRWRRAAPFQSLIFILLMIYDLLTLKTATLLLPYFPWADKILNAMIADAAFLAESASASISLLFQGFIIGAVLGIVTGVFSGYNKKINYWISPFVTVIGSIPTTTWIPIVMVLAASLQKGAMFIIALGVFFSLHNATFSGVNQIDKAYYSVAKTLGASQRQLISSVTVPAMLPTVFSGLIQGMSTACTSLIVAEMMGVESGLGFYITWQKNWAEYDKMYAGIIVICVLFLAVHFILNWLSDRTLKWKED